MPALDGNSKVEVADRELESTVGKDVEQLAEIPELSVVRVLHTDKCCSATHQQGNSRVAVLEILSVASCSIYCGGCLEGEVHGEDCLGSSVGDMGYSCVRFGIPS